MRDFGVPGETVIKKPVAQHNPKKAKQSSFPWLCFLQRLSRGCSRNAVPLAAAVQISRPQQRNFFPWWGEAQRTEPCQQQWDYFLFLRHHKVPSMRSLLFIPQAQLHLELLVATQSYRYQCRFQDNYCLACAALWLNDFKYCICHKYGWA